MEAFKRQHIPGRGIAHVKNWRRDPLGHIGEQGLYVWTREEVGGGHGQADFGHSGRGFGYLDEGMQVVERGLELKED